MPSGGSLGAWVMLAMLPGKGSAPSSCLLGICCLEISSFYEPVKKGFITCSS